MTSVDALLARLYDVADDAEAAVLDALLIRANVLWKCPKCLYQNPASLPRCEQCAAPRPKGTGCPSTPST